MKQTSQLIREDIESNGHNIATSAFLRGLAAARGVPAKACAEYASAYAVFVARDKLVTPAEAAALGVLAARIDGEP